MLAFNDFCRRSQVFNAAIGARADKHPVNSDIADLFAAFEAHIVQRTLNGGAALFVSSVLGARNRAVDAGNVLRAGAPCHNRGEIRRIQMNFSIEMRAFVRMQMRPIGHGFVPVGTLRRFRTAIQIVIGFVIRRNQPGAGTALNRHVADGHPPFHRQSADRLTRIFNHIAGAARGTDFADDGQHNVLRGNAVRQFAVHGHAHIFGLGLNQCLGGQHMLHFRGADAVRQRAKCAMRRGMAVTANNGGAR